MKENEAISLKNKHAIVVGASSGLGEALAVQLIEQGAEVTAFSRKIETNSSLSKAFKVNCDITDATDIGIAFYEVDKRNLPIDFLINVAGIGLMKKLEDTTSKEIENVLSTNLKGIILTTQEAYRRMKHQGFGRIINVSSTSGFKPRALEPVYSASKFGLKGFTESMKLAGVEDGIDVIGVYPGGMNTKTFWKDQPDKDLSEYMEPSFVAGKIVELMKTPSQDLPNELVIERPQH